MEFNKFSQIEYVRPDFKKVAKEIKGYIRQMKKATSYQDFKKAFKSCQDVLINVDTLTTLAYIRNTVDMNDKFYDKEHEYINKSGAPMELALIALSDAILKSKFVPEIKAEYGEYLIKDIEMSKKVRSPKIILLSINEGDLCQKYSKAVASCKTDFRGEECNFYGLLKHMESTDRQERKEAFEAWAAMYEKVSGTLDEIYDKLVEIRVKKAKRLKFDSFIDFAYISNGRYDYDKKDVAAFRESVRKYIVPICRELYDKQAAALGVDKLRYYDEELTFSGGNALPIGTESELVEKAKKMYEQLSSVTGEFFDFMYEHEAYDLTTKPGKHLGGYCTFLPLYLSPFIFSNFNGTSQDVDVLTHEAGHALQMYLTARNVELINQFNTTSEIAEIHSMSMEHFTYPYMDEFFGENADKYRYHHLCNSIECIPYLVSVDEYQHVVFENPKMSAMERRAAWKAIEQKYLPWRDYDGNKFLSEGGFWMQKQHIFLYPFYYVDYALAQTCAYQFFLKGLENFDEAFARYVDLCKMGGTKGYFDTLKSAGLDNPFDENTVKWVSEKIRKVIADFESKIG